MKRRRAEIEATAIEETKTVRAQQHQQREQERAERDRELKKQQRALHLVRDQITQANRELDEVRTRTQEEEKILHAAAEHLDGSRERLIREFTAFHGLLEHIQAVRNEAAVRPMITAPPVASADPIFDDMKRLVEERLAPILSGWTTGTTILQAKLLHAAILSCRWILVPNPAWGIAYAEAIGPEVRFRVVAVEPTWLTFDDAWKSEAGAFWCEAVQTTGLLHLLIFADADRALPQCWSRPWLDVLTGYRSALPSPANQIWPANLRVLVCPAEDDAVLPVPDSVLAHWASVGAAKDAARSSDMPVPGHVPYAVWANWVPASYQGSLKVAPEAAKLGGAARAATNELHRLRQVLEAMGFDAQGADERAVQIRVTGAQSFFGKDDPR